MRRSEMCGVVTLAVAAILCVATTRARATDGVSQQLDDARVTQLLEELAPDESQLWRTIPWKISMLDGQREASEQKKPLFIWAMDGHPLGCT